MENVVRENNSVLMTTANYSNSIEEAKIELKNNTLKLSELDNEVREIKKKLKRLKNSLQASEERHRKTLDTYEKNKVNLSTKAKEEFMREIAKIKKNVIENRNKIEYYENGEYKYKINILNYEISKLKYEISKADLEIKRYQKGQLLKRVNTSRNNEARDLLPALIGEYIKLIIASAISDYDGYDKLSRAESLAYGVSNEYFRNSLYKKFKFSEAEIELEEKTSSLRREYSDKVEEIRRKIFSIDQDIRIIDKKPHLDEVRQLGDRIDLSYGSRFNQLSEEINKRNLELKEIVVKYEKIDFFLNEILSYEKKLLRTILPGAEKMRRMNKMTPYINEAQRIKKVRESYSSNKRSSTKAKYIEKLYQEARVFMHKEELGNLLSFNESSFKTSGLYDLIVSEPGNYDKIFDFIIKIYNKGMPINGQIGASKK